MNQLVLSLFPGIDLLGMAFDEFGFTVVRGPDVIFGGDIRRFHPPAGRFDGVIGGPPCQCFSRLAHMVRHNGYEPKFGNLIPEFERCVEEASPEWFLMENVPDAPPAVCRGYVSHEFTFNNRDLGESQNRLRRWTFGTKGSVRRPLLIDIVALNGMPFRSAVVGGSSRQNGLGRQTDRKRRRRGRMPFNTKSEDVFRDSCATQGLPADFDLPGWTKEGKCKAIGNGVPLATGRAMARAVIETLGLTGGSTP